MKNASMHTIVEIVSSGTSTICMNLTYFIKPGMKNESISIGFKSVDRDGIGSNFVIHQNHFDQLWTKRRIRSYPLQKGKYNMTLTLSSENIFIGDIHSCTKAGVLNFNQLTE